MRTADIGHPLLSMHSIRETIADSDHLAMCNLLAAHYRSRIELP
jgi:aspartyl aminopeptidase